MILNGTATLFRFFSHEEKCFKVEIDEAGIVRRILEETLKAANIGLNKNYPDSPTVKKSHLHFHTPLLLFIYPQVRVVYAGALREFRFIDPVLWSGFPATTRYQHPTPLSFLYFCDEMNIRHCIRHIQEQREERDASIMCW